MADNAPGAEVPGYTGRYRIDLFGVVWCPGNRQAGRPKRTVGALNRADTGGVALELRAPTAPMARHGNGAGGGWLYVVMPMSVAR